MKAHLEGLTSKILVRLAVASQAHFRRSHTQRWITTYNGRQVILLKFFKWLHDGNEPDNKKRITPPCMIGVRQLPRKDKNTYTPSNLWDAKDHALFLKYCPSKRDRAYHSMANDTYARPHELLNLKICDIRFKQTEYGKTYPHHI